MGHARKRGKRKISPADEVRKKINKNISMPSTSGVQNPRGKKLVLSESSSSDSEEVESVCSLQSIPKGPRKVKPIIVDASVQVIMNFIKNSSCKFIKSPSMAFKGPNKTQIFCYSVEDKNAIMKSLKEKQFVFHSFAESGEKKKVFVLKGYCYEQDLTKMCKTFQEAGVNCHKITFLSKNKDYPIYLFHFEDPNTSVISLQKQCHEINSLLVRWKTKLKSKSRPTQCYNCQLYGHAASSCNRPYRCVKCLDHHLPGKCKRTSRVGNASCVNCKGDHSANSVVCPHYVKYREVITSKTSSTAPVSQQQSYAQAVRKTHQQSAQPRLAAAAAQPDVGNIAQFPSLPKENSNRVEDMPTSTSSSLTSELSSLVSELLQIPDLREIIKLFRLMIGHLKNKTSDDIEEGISKLFSFAFTKNNTMETNQSKPRSPPNLKTLKYS